MLKILRRLALSLAASPIIAVSAPAPEPEAEPIFWRPVANFLQNRPAAEVWVQPLKSFSFEVDHDQLGRVLAGTPLEGPAQARGAGKVIRIPTPTGKPARFRLEESPVMAPELAAKFPEIKTYIGQGIDDPAATLRMDVTPAGFHAQVLTPEGSYYVDPMWRNDRTLHSSYYKRDHQKPHDGFECLVPPALDEAPPASVTREANRSGNNLRIYRLACAATAEYTQATGGSVSAAMAAIVTAINRISGIYETELAIRLVLVPNNDALIFTTSSTDPYSNNNGSAMLDQNQTTIDSIIGNANYDIGHVFSTGGGGIASLASVCQSSSKARGVTGSPTPTGDSFYVDYVAHEMGHQFGGNHTFNSNVGSCSGNRNSATAFEPGSGSTILGYAGLCSGDNLQGASDPYFHSITFDEIVAYVTSGGGADCAVLSATGNSAPTVNAGPDYTIPRHTPFTLTATGSDPDGDTLTFCWEERDSGPAQALSLPDNGVSPIFRSFPPTVNPSRTFPKLSSLLSNTTTPGEKIPTTGRALKFRVTARDNRASGGGVNTDDMRVTTTSSAGPFVVTAPNSSVSWSGARSITWNVANTSIAPVNTATVNILLSTNGGNSFPFLLAANTPNDGSETVQLPNLNTTQARVKVEAVGNIFFDVSDANFSITPGASAPFVTLDSALLVSESCAPTNHAIDPNEFVTIQVTLRNLGGTATTNLVATLLATNGVISPSGPQNYGLLAGGGGGAVTRSFTFTASGVCGSTLRTSIQLTDGSQSLGVVETIFPLGNVTTSVSSNSNSAIINIPSSGPASVYPSSIFVSGVVGALTKATVTVVGLSHQFPDDVEMVLVAPNNQSVMLMSHAGGGSSINGVTITFDSTAITGLPSSSQIESGTFLPTNHGNGDPLPFPAPSGPYDNSLNTFNGISPNGTWSLYVYDSASGDSGNISGGWRLSMTTSATNCCVGNAPPMLSAISDRQTPEDTPIQVSFTVNDLETSPDSLVLNGYSSNTNLVPDANLIFSGTGTNRMLTIVPVANQFGSAAITISVSDGVSANSATFQITVTSQNDPPVLSFVSPRTINEGVVLQITNVATDIEGDALSFSLEGTVPFGAVINASSGVFTWVPGEEQGPGSYTITLRVTDNGEPPLSDVKKFMVTVLEVNSSPVLTPPSNQVVYVGELVSLPNSTMDDDFPTNRLTYSFDLATAGASLNPTNGLFQWTASTNQVGTNFFTVRVVDDGSPALSDAETFSIVVLAPPRIVGVNRQDSAITLTWTARAGREYRVQYRDDLAMGQWVDLPGDTLASENTASIAISTVVSGQRFYRILVLP